MAKKYYLDTCIWLNLFKKEGDSSKGKPYWKIAKEFIRKVLSKHDEIIYSNFVLKEIEYKLDNNLFSEKLIFIKDRARPIKANSKDYAFARYLESNSMYSISFYDCMNIALCKSNGFILVTRDRELLKYAKSYVRAGKPEDLV